MCAHGVEEKKKETRRKEKHNDVISACVEEEREREVTKKEEYPGRDGRGCMSVSMWERGRGGCYKDCRVKKNKRWKGSNRKG